MKKQGFLKIYDYMDAFLNGKYFADRVNDIVSFNINVEKQSIKLVYRDGEELTETIDNICCGVSPNACKYCTAEEREDCDSDMKLKFLKMQEN